MKNKQNLIVVFLLFIFIAFGCAKYGGTTSTQNSTPSVKALMAPATATPKQSPTPTPPIVRKVAPKPASSPTLGEPDVYASKDKNSAEDEEGSGTRGGYKTDNAAADSSRYITGPRGGCYYLNGNGNKTYVDHSFCGREDTQAASARNLSPPTVKSAADTPASSGASAKCADGSLSFSATRRGTCSHHGGVAEWY